MQHNPLSSLQVHPERVVFLQLTRAPTAHGSFTSTERSYRMNTSRNVRSAVRIALAACATTAAIPQAHGQAAPAPAASTPLIEEVKKAKAGG